MEELSRIDSIITYIKNKTTSFLNEDDSKISGVEASDISYDLKNRSSKRFKNIKHSVEGWFSYKDCRSTCILSRLQNSL